MPQMFAQFSKTLTGYVGCMGNYLIGKDNPYNVWTLSNNMQLSRGFFEIYPTWNSKSSGLDNFQETRDHIIAKIIHHGQPSNRERCQLTAGTKNGSTVPFTVSNIMPDSLTSQSKKSNSKQKLNDVYTLEVKK
jgi:hypothetical protein